MVSVIKKKKIAGDVIRRIAPMCCKLAAMQCNRTRVISNDHLLGIVVGMSDIVGRIGAGNTLSDADARRVTLHVIDRLYGRNGVKAAKRAMKSKKPAFTRGVKNGQHIVKVAACGHAELPNKAATQRAATPADELCHFSGTATLQHARSIIPDQYHAPGMNAWLEAST